MLKPSSYRHQRDMPKSQNFHDVCIEQAFKDNCQLIDSCFVNAQTKAYIFYATG